MCQEQEVTRGVPGCMCAGRTASLVSKYRPPMPILTLVIPQLKNDGMRFQLVGRGVARQCQIQRGLLPVLAAPSPSGDPSALVSVLVHCALLVSIRSSPHPLSASQSNAQARLFHAMSFQYSL